MRERLFYLAKFALYPWTGKLSITVQTGLCYNKEKEIDLDQHSTTTLSTQAKKFITWMERQKEITLNEISPLQQPRKTQVLLHLHAKSIIQHKLSLKKRSSLQPLFQSLKKPQISVVLSLPSDGTVGMSHCTSDHGQRVVVCLGCRCQS